MNDRERLESIREWLRQSENPTRRRLTDPNRYRVQAEDHIEWLADTLEKTLGALEQAQRTIKHLSDQAHRASVESVNTWYRGFDAGEKAEWERRNLYNRQQVEMMKSVPPLNPAILAELAEFSKTTEGDADD